MSLLSSLTGRLRAGPYDREILRLAVPALGTLVAEPLYVLADTAIVGHLGTVQLGGLALATNVLLTGFAVFIFLAYGTTASVSRLLGAGDEQQAAHQATQGMWLAAAIGVFLAVAGWVFGPALIDLLGGEGEVRTNALIYLRISLIGFPALLVTLAGTGYLRGLQDTRRPLYIALGTALANLVLESILIYGFDQGIGASALSTVVAQAGGAAVYVTWVGRAVRAHGVSLRPDPRTIGRLLVVGLDLLVRTAALRGSFTFSTAVAARIGTVDLAAHQIAFEVWAFLALSLDAIAIAGQAMIGRFLGADDADGARAVGRRMLEWGLGVGVVFAIVVGLLRSPIAHIFSSDPDVIALAAFVLGIVAVMQPLNGVVFALDGILIGAGDMRFLAWAMAAAAAVFIPAAVLVLVTGAGIGWLWGSLALLMLSRFALLQWRFLGDGWLVTGAVRARR
ncbi:MAG: MATE family efflux transporter [Actinomycetota bacterium]|nr:MATE family efflux transporter [Actinomycetota bacterium]